MVQGARRRPDYWLIVVVVSLLVFGLLMVYSTTFDRAYRFTGNSLHYAGRQAGWALLGVGLAAVLAVVDYDWLRRMAVPVMGGTLVLLLLLLAIGDDRLGARRSLLDGSIQPGELAKLTTAIYIAAWVSSKGEQIRDLTYGLIPFATLMGLTAGLVVLQPDLSTAAVIVLTGLIAFFIGGADLLQMVIFGIAGGLAFWVLVRLHPYATDRLQEFLMMLRDPAMGGYHARESVIALGSGGVFGTGLGLGRQKFGYLPVPHTDSIFAAIGEELGLLGCLLVVALFALLAWRGYRIAQRARDGFGMVLACGLTTLLVSQALVNFGVVVGMLPFTGMVLPFVSLGGSSLLVSLAAVGILISVSRGTSSGGKTANARLARGRRDGRTRLSGSSRPAGA
jgi:cell division protein FtsW